MLFGDLYNLFELEVLFEARMKNMIFFRGTKNQFENVKNTDYKGFESLQVSSLSLDIESTEHSNLAVIKIEISKISIFKFIGKERIN